MHLWYFRSIRPGNTVSNTWFSRMCVFSMVFFQRRNENFPITTVRRKQVARMMDFGEIVLLLCGNFNPITNMHLRMFGKKKRIFFFSNSVFDFVLNFSSKFSVFAEIAKDHLANIGYSVFKGLISPYEKNKDDQNFVSVEHRIAMIKYALNSSNWIQLSSWHCEKFDLPTIATMLQHHQVFVQKIPKILNNSKVVKYFFHLQSRLDVVFKNHSDDSEEKFGAKNCRFVVKLLCGADVLLCMKNPDNINEVRSIFRIFAKKEKYFRPHFGTLSF